MKKWRADDFWFELTEGPSPDGVGFARYNEVTCRKCGTKANHLACGQSVDQLRKYFIRQNWEIGRSRFHHICPECAHKHKHRPTPTPLPSNVVPLRPPPQHVTLQEAWDQAAESERAEFCALMGLLRLDQLQRAHVMPAAEWQQHGHHIDSMPVEPELPPIENAPVTIPDEDDDEAADWWLELQNRKSANGEK